MTRQQAGNLIEDSRMKVAVAVFLIVTAVTNTFFVTKVYFQAEYRIARLESALETKRDKGFRSWNRTAQILWSADFAELNPTLFVPDAQSLKYSSDD